MISLRADGQKATMEQNLSQILIRTALDSDQELQQYVVSALNKKVQGDATSYMELVNAIKSATDDNELSCLLAAVGKNTTCLKKKSHQALIVQSLSKAWSGSDRAAGYGEALAVNSVSANADFLQPTLGALVDRFLVVRPSSREVPEKDKTSNHMPLCTLGKQAERVHHVLRRVLEIFPTGTMTLLELLKQQFPHKRKEVELQTCYLENLLSCIDYLQQLRSDVLHLILDRMIKIDVEIMPFEDANDSNDSAHGEVFDMEFEDDEAHRKPELSDNALRAQKMDQMMFLLLQFVRHTLSKANNSAERQETFEAFTQVFEQQVLTTYRSKYAQFFMFYACSFRDSYLKDFVSLLIQKTIENNSSDTARLAASAYLASFIARFKPMRAHHAKTSISLLSTWIHEYIEKHDQAISDPDPVLHNVFYSLVQSLFYALCFRAHQLVDDPKYVTFVKMELRVPDIVLSNLNPLKVVNPPVVQQFLRVCQRHGIMTDDQINQIVTHNSRFVLPGAQEFAEENSFFPFDPYNLELSRTLIDPIYQSWERANEDVSDEDSATGDNAGTSADESIAMSLNSQLSLSDQVERDSPHSAWKPMSFTPPR